MIPNGLGCTKPILTSKQQLIFWWDSNDTTAIFQNFKPYISGYVQVWITTQPKNFRELLDDFKKGIRLHWGCRNVVPLLDKSVSRTRAKVGSMAAGLDLHCRHKWNTQKVVSVAVGVLVLLWFLAFSYRTHSRVECLPTPLVTCWVLHSPAWIVITTRLHGLGIRHRMQVVLLTIKFPRRATFIAYNFPKP